MLNWLTQLFNRIRYGKLITEDYTGKVVRVCWGVRKSDGDGSWSYRSNSLITVLWDDGKYDIAGPIFVQHKYDITPVNPETGLFHAHKGRVTVVANSVEDYKETQRIKGTRKTCQQSVCSNEAGEVGIVTDYDGSTYSGRTLEGSPWKAKDIKCLAVSYKDYTERKVLR